MYSQKIKHYNHIFRATVDAYRAAVDFFISVCMEEWDSLSILPASKTQMNHLEAMTHPTARRPHVAHAFDTADKRFYKFPSYLRRAACMEAIGKVSAYKSTLEVWEKTKEGRRPGAPKAGYVYPCLYRDNMYKEGEPYTAKIKVYIRNTWDWLTVGLRRSDVDYVTRHCGSMKQSSPTLQKRGKEWFLDFLYTEESVITKKEVRDQIILAVDLGIHNACTCACLLPDGTVAGRRFLRLPAEEDRLKKAVNRIKKAQQHGNRKMPRLWARAVGINDDIAVKTAAFIMEAAASFHADVIVFEHLDRAGRKRGSKRQRLHMWKADYVQNMVESKAHRLGRRVSRICAWNTSRLAYDGSGEVKRGKESERTNGSYSVCEFPTGKIYNCDLNASYNIGARYFIREILKSLPERERLAAEAKVPASARRSTCTLSTLINLHAVLAAQAAGY
jgi:IS605 OrfB family transposase